MVNKRFLAVLLSAAMVFTSFTMPVFAEEIDEAVIADATTEAVIEDEAEVIEETIDETLDVEEAAEEEVTVDDGSEVIEPVAEEASEGEQEEEQEQTPATETVVAETAAVVGATDTASENFAAYTNAQTDKKYATAVINENGKVKVSWKAVKGAKKYKIRKVNNGSNETVSSNVSYIPFSTTKWSKDEKKNVTKTVYVTKKKYAVDKDYDPKDKSVYAVEMYDKNDSLLAVYVATPAVKIYQVENNIAGNAIDVVFANVGADEYVVETCKGSSKFNANKTEKYPIKEKTVSADDVKTGAIGAVKTAQLTIGGSDLAFEGDVTLEHANIDVKKGNRIFVRMTPVVKSGITGLSKEVAVKVSGAKGCQITKYAAPSINRIESETGHKEGCYAGARIYFNVINQKDSNQFFKTPNSSSLRYEVQYSSDGTKYTTLAVIKGGAVSANSATKEYSFSVTDLKPEIEYSYRIRAYAASDLTEMSAWSIPALHSFKFPAVTSVSADSLKKGSVKLTWDSEKCATAYKVYKTTKPYLTEAEAAAAAKKGNEDIARLASTKKASKNILKEAGLKLVKTVVNEERESDTVSAEIGKCNAGKYYGFVVYPVNGETYGYKHGSETVGYAIPAAPANFKYTSSGTSKFKLSWKKVKGATGYRVERITLSGNNLSKFEDATDEVWETLSANIISKDITGTKLVVTPGSSSTSVESAVAGDQYAYRVRTIYNSNLVTEPTDSVVACIGPKKIKSLTITPLLTGEDSWKDNHKNGSKPLYAVSDNEFREVGDRPVKITIKANTDKKSVTEYQVQKKIEGGDYEEFYNFEANDTAPKKTDKYKMFKTGAASFTFYDSNLERGKKYTYRVRPVFANGTVGSWKSTSFSVGAGWIAYAVNRPSNGTTGGANTKYQASNKFNVASGVFQITNASNNPLYIKENTTSRIYVEFLDKAPGSAGTAGKIMELPTYHEFTASSADTAVAEVSEPMVKTITLADGSTKDVCYVDIKGVKASSDGDDISTKITLTNKLPKDGTSTSILPALSYYVSIAGSSATASK